MQSKDYKIAFMGQTGRGKSSLLNALFGTQFATDDIEECTKEIHSVTFLGDDDHQIYSVFDTPGIGASNSNDRMYSQFYEYILGIVDCIVWVTNMQRTDKLDQEFFRDFGKHIKKETKLIICVNQIDIFTPNSSSDPVWNNDTNEPSEVLIHYLTDSDAGRLPYVSSKLSKYIPIEYSLHYASAWKKYGIDELKQLIFKTK